MDGTAVSKIAELALQGQIHGIDGKIFSPSKMYRVYADPRPAPFTVHSLAGVVDYIESEIDGAYIDGAIPTVSAPLTLAIHVSDYNQVDLITRIYGESVTRDVLVSARYDGPEPFRFNTWLDPETFIIGLQSQFVATEAASDLLQFVSKLSIKNEATMDDDGITQKVAMVKGVSGAVVAKQAAPGRVVLSPFRTFSEVLQPEQTFRFRIKSDRGVECALYEADGGAWRNTARERIAGWFRGRAKLPVIA